MLRTPPLSPSPKSPVSLLNIAEVKESAWFTPRPIDCSTVRATSRSYSIIKDHSQCEVWTLFPLKAEAAVTSRAAGVGTQADVTGIIHFILRTLSIGYIRSIQDLRKRFNFVCIKLSRYGLAGLEGEPVTNGHRQIDITSKLRILHMGCKLMPKYKQN